MKEPVPNTCVGAGEAPLSAYIPDRDPTLQKVLTLGKLPVDAKGRIEFPDLCRTLRIDIGTSHSAPVTRAWLDRDPTACVLGIEALPYHYDLVKERFAKDAPRLLMLPTALGNHTQPFITFYGYKGDSQTSSISKNKAAKVDQVYEVPLLTFAQLLSLLPWRRFPYIEHCKIDTQGSDMWVMMGAGALLDNCVFLTAEIVAKAWDHMYDDAPTQKEIVDWVARRGGFIYLGPNIGESASGTWLSKRWLHLAREIDYRLSSPTFWDEKILAAAGV